MAEVTAPARAQPLEHKQRSYPKPTCPAQHGLTSFTTPNSSYSCDKCGNAQREQADMHGCRDCNYDLCQACYDNAASATLTRNMAEESMAKVALPPFPVLGLSLAALRELAAEQVEGEGTTADYCTQVVMPRTAADKMAYTSYLQTHGKEHDVGVANCFISHAWTYKFRDVVAAIKTQVVKGDETPIFYWFDMVSVNQHERTIYPQEWWKTTFQGSLQTIGRAYLVLAPWRDPRPLTRAWCLWEIYSAIEGKCDLKVCLTGLEQESLENDLCGDGGEGFRAIEQSLAKIDSANADAWLQADKEMIFQAIRTSVGFQGINGKVKGLLREWLYNTVKSLLVQKRHQVEHTPSEEVEKRSIELCFLTFNAGVMLSDIYGKYDEAIDMFTEAVRLETKQFGEKSDKTLGTRSSLAATLTKAGRYAESLAMLEESLSLLPVEAQAIRVAMLTNKGATLFRLGRYDECKQAYEEALEVCKSNQQEQEGFLKLEANYARIRYDMGDKEYGLQALEKNLQARKGLLGANHISTLSIVRIVAQLLAEDDSVRDRAQRDKAINYSNWALAGYKENLGPMHEDTIATLVILAACLTAAGTASSDWEKAHQVLQQVPRKQMPVEGHLLKNFLFRLLIVQTLRGQLADCVKVGSELADLDADFYSVTQGALTCQPHVLVLLEQAYRGLGQVAKANATASRMIEVRMQKVKETGNAKAVRKEQYKAIIMSLKSSEFSTALRYCDAAQQYDERTYPSGPEGQSDLSGLSIDEHPGWICVQRGRALVGLRRFEEAITALTKGNTLISYNPHIYLEIVSAAQECQPQRPIPFFDHIFTEIHKLVGWSGDFTLTRWLTLRKERVEAGSEDAVVTLTWLTDTVKPLLKADTSHFGPHARKLAEDPAKNELLACVLLAVTLRALQWEKLASQVCDLSALSPEDALEAAKLYYDSQLFAAALPFFEASAKGARGEAAYMHATALFQLKSYHAAIARLQSALEEEPQHVDMAGMCVSLSLALQEFATGAKVGLAYLATEAPGTPANALSMKLTGEVAACLARMGDFTKAQEYLRLALKAANELKDDAVGSKYLSQLETVDSILKEQAQQGRSEAEGAERCARTPQGQHAQPSATTTGTDAEQPVAEAAGEGEMPAASTNSEAGAPGTGPAEPVRAAPADSSVVAATGSTVPVEEASDITRAKETNGAKERQEVKEAKKISQEQGADQARKEQGISSKPEAATKANTDRALSENVQATLEVAGTGKTNATAQSSKNAAQQSASNECCCLQ